MPANLPPEYKAAEKKFKTASTTAEKIAALEDLISTVPKHKGTDHLRADLRRRLSQLNKESLEQRKKKGGGRDSLYNIPKEGAAQMALVGFANAGKSSILASLTKATPVVADYPLSTLLPLPGMMPYEDIQFQLVDLPPIANETTDGWVSGIIRIADGLLVVVDLAEDVAIQLELILEQLGKWNISTQAEKTAEFRGVTRRALVVANKKDLPGAEENFGSMKETFGTIFPMVAVSCLRKEGLEDLKREIFRLSGVIRVYSKPPGKPPDLSMPFTVPAGCTVTELAEKIHKEFVVKMKFARIWGSAKFEGMKVERNYVLKDRDIVEINS
ncbi:MAG TPA: TGS domain-containing protein [Syntrophales bacterium]|nr:TGS domain-containing protein [Syntrophales bacterium]HPI58554.1 TGS domain-containing protein [Syntrophales bacterium]HPN26247.1 TGS domain-containing protein [Syntrophales bacterium]HQM30425.1 TGS domain-containing protein [Syntrophales bacterium]